MRGLALLALSCAVLQGAIAAGARAQPTAGVAVDPAAPAPAPDVLSFTVSGGVSLGAFEAGVLHFLTEAVKRSEGDAELRIATGASAGSANALISLVDSCSPRVDDPQGSLGFRTWVPVGIAQLFDPKRVTATSIFTRAPMRAAMGRLAQTWRAGLRADCDVVLGVSVTRKTPTLAALTKPDQGPTVQVPRSEEKFVVHIQGRGPGRPPRLRNYVDPTARVAQPLLPLSESEDDAAQMKNFDRLADLLYASASFPLAFSPFPLEFCESDPAQPSIDGDAATAGSVRCDHAERALFFDGGVFDNSPLRLNYNVVQRGLRRDAAGIARWLDAPAAHEGQPPRVRYSYIDPAATVYPALDKDKEKEDTAPTPPDALDLMLDLARSFIQTSRGRELLALIEETGGAELREQMHLTHNQLPTMSGQLGAFFGFFERDFRELDFYLGMYDGLVSIRRAIEERGMGDVARARLVAAFPALQQPLRSDLLPGQKPFACLLSQIEPEYAGHAAACDGPELRNFRILLQVTLDRLHAACARVPEKDLPRQAMPLCFAASRGEPRRQVRGVSAIELDECKRRGTELDFGYTLRLLSAYHFTYRDLGLDADEAKYGPVKVRRRLLSMSDRLADAQPGPMSKALIAVAGRASANQIAYEPPRNWVYVSAGTAIELGASLLPVSWNQSWVRLNLALQVSHWESMVTPDRFTLGATPLAGPEFQLLFLSSAALQSMLGARVGYQAAWLDRGGARDCTDHKSFGDARNCSQLVLQGYAAIALIERLRAQFVVETYPTEQEAKFKSRLGLQLTFGLQLF
jgi:hypothetical protein